MIRKSGNRFSEKIMLHQKDRAPNRFNLKPSRSRKVKFLRRLIASIGARRIKAVLVEFLGDQTAPDLHRKDK
jgi:hypothetical protein